MAPGQFLREINIKIEDKNYTTDEKKIECFRNNLDYGGTADLWLDDLPAADTATWAMLVAAFHIEWPKMAAVKPSKAERIRALKEWKLKLEELGKKTETLGGKEVWTHVKWADGIVAKAKDAEDGGGLLLQDIVDGLPTPVRDLIRHQPHTTYKELADAVRAVDVVELRDGVSKYTKDEETARLARVNAANVSPTRAIRESLSPHSTPTRPSPICAAAAATVHAAATTNQHERSFQQRGRQGNPLWARSRQHICYTTWRRNWRFGHRPRFTTSIGEAAHQPEHTPRSTRFPETP
jgi:hypothetical protein